MRLSPADELAEVRAEIARLRLREAQLKDRLLHAPLAALTGRWHRIEITQQITRHFDATLLPASIRDDPAYWRERLHHVIRTVAIPPKSAPPRPGWPIRRNLPLPDPLQPRPWH
ncbi:hypothetical protein [Rhodobacter amnigenus]|uniref:hypothetical protein n=1 Tax=Paragemmobacter amnigenus TaxID=2852097 RepID=UPI001E5C4037|nr:hypothetical protein [Rhodobacter amnigenus]